MSGVRRDIRDPAFSPAFAGAMRATALPEHKAGRGRGVISFSALLTGRSNRFCALERNFIRHRPVIGQFHKMSGRFHQFVKNVLI
jgi:hypothetical protein